MKRIRALTLALTLLTTAESLSKECKKCAARAVDEANQELADQTESGNLPLLQCLSHPEVLIQTPFAAAALFCCGTYICAFAKECVREPKKWISITEKASLALVLGFCSNYILKKAFKPCKDVKKNSD